MRRLFLLIVPLAWALPAVAQTAPKSEAAVPSITQQHDHTAALDQSLEQSIQANLARAGFTDVEILPTEFVVRAKDADGNPVMLVLSPESISELKETAPGQASEPDDPPSGNTSSDKNGPVAQ